jgi:uncharacterized protein (DUF2141 family)
MMSAQRFRSGIFFVFLLLVSGMILSVVKEVNASSELSPELQPTPFLTPTPGPDGQIIYIVQDGDSFWSIAAIAGISLEELYAMNGIQPNDYAIPGTELVLGFAGPSKPTAEVGAQITPTSAEPTATPIFSTGEICVLLFLDTNGNARLDEGELGLSNGQISIVDVSGVVAKEASTDENPEGKCFTDLEAGDYNVSAAVPEEYNPTTSMNLPLRLMAGDIKYVQFGAQPSAALLDQDPGDKQGGSQLLGLFGVFLLLAAGGLAFYASRYSRRSPKLGK